MSDLALLGGEPVIAEPLPRYRSLGEAEERAVLDVVRSGRLSGFFGSWQDGFLGGPKVPEFEAAWAERFEVTHAVSVNSNTNGCSPALAPPGWDPATK